MIVDDEIIRRAVNKWEETVPIEYILNLSKFKQHMREVNGVEVTGSVFKLKFKVIDEKKYTMFLLRFS